MALRHLPGGGPVALTLLLVLAVAGSGAACWLAEFTLRRLSRSNLAAPAVDDLGPLYLIDPALDRCWMCVPAADPHRYDGLPCPTCRLLLAVFPDEPVPFWPKEES